VVSVSEERSIDWRFRYRGEIAAPVKVVYVDIDPRTIDEIGNWPEPQLFRAACPTCWSTWLTWRAIGFDFVLSAIGHAESADLKKVAEAISHLPSSSIRIRAPRGVGASFTGQEFRTAENKISHRSLPLVAKRARRSFDD